MRYKYWQFRFGWSMILLIVSNYVIAQKSDSSLIDKKYFISFFKDSRDLVLSPGKIRREDWNFAGAAVLAIPAGFMFDEPVEKFFRRQEIRSGNEEWLDYSISNFGNGLYPGAAALVLYGIGACKKRDDLKWMALLQIKTLGISVAASRVPKYLFQRKRPDENIPVNAWNWSGPLQGFTGNYSFTSGHTFIAFSWAAVTASAYKEKKGLVIGLYSVASLVGASRVYKGEHWSSDVLGRAVLGYALGKLMYRFQEKNWMKRPYRKNHF